MHDEAPSILEGNDRLLSVKEVAAFLKVAPNTVRALTDRGELRCYRVGGRAERRFSRAQVVAYLSTQEQQPSRYPNTEGTGAGFIKEPAPGLSCTATLNRGLQVHDWYLIPESYSEPLVVDALERFGIGRGQSVLDPFAGAGTTLVSSALRGVDSVGLEVNPFLAFASRVKLNWSIDTLHFGKVASELLEHAEGLLASDQVDGGLFSKPHKSGVSQEAEEILASEQPPFMPRLYKWMSPRVVQKVLILRRLIEVEVPEGLRPHFNLALAAVLRPASNMKLTPHAFGSRVVKQDAPVLSLFAQKITKMRDDLDFVHALDNPLGRSQVIECDAKCARGVASELLPASLAITSPPYLNNLDYTMQTRMELFFLRFVQSMEELRTLRKAMVTCDAKAMYKDVTDHEEVQSIASVKGVAERLEEAHRSKKWGWDYAFMTRQYFGGMMKVFRTVADMLKPGARFVLIVGESAHSGVKVAVPEILGELGEMVGYRLEDITLLRSRRSSSHDFQLSESAVVLKRR